MEVDKQPALMARLPQELRPEIERIAKGNGSYPATSVQAAIEFLVRAGLDAYKRQQQSQEAR
jgi:hypothetical protein